MRANGALQVLGFLLSLAQGSEVGNSQAGKRRGSTGRLGTWDSEPNSRCAGGQGQELGLCEAGGAEPRRAGAPWVETVRIRFLAWSGAGTGFPDHYLAPVTSSLPCRGPSDLSLRIGLMLKQFTLLRGPAGRGAGTSIL